MVMGRCQDYAGFVSMICLSTLCVLHEIMHKCIQFKASEAKRAKLTDEDRSASLAPLHSKGWTMVEGRDAVYKEFLFTNFNQV